MASITSINVGATANDGSGDQLRVAGVKTNANVTALNTELIAATTKLAGIEANATTDQSAAEILAALLTVDGAGSGLNADLLDGSSSASFASASQGSLADTAVQPGGLAAVAVSNDYGDLDNLPDLNPSNTDQVAPDANNDLTVNPLFWSGTETEYAGHAERRHAIFRKS